MRTKVVVVLMVLFIGALVATGLDKSLISSNANRNFETDDLLQINRDTDISVNSMGELCISREDTRSVSLGEDGTWSIFMYVCGTDLESYYQKFTQDLKEMCGADFDKNINDKVKIIIQTGGCDDWYTPSIRGNKVQRFMLQRDGLKLLEEKKLVNMGSKETLYDYLEWGINNYPAEKMGVVFWNHGTGVSQGLCNDPNFSEDSLMLGELEYSFAKLKNTYNCKFEMLGFDTCLSGSLEYANVLASYSNYMVASADAEPGDGWSYTKFIDYLFENSRATGEDIGKVVIDEFYKSYKRTNAKNNITLALYDLSKVDNVCKELNALARNINKEIKGNKDKYEDMVVSLEKAVIYEGLNVDIGSLTKNLQLNVDTTKVKNTINDLVIYKKIGKKYSKKGAVGISVYMPTKYVNMNSYNVYRNIGFSPYWMNLVTSKSSSLPQ